MTNWLPISSAPRPNAKSGCVEVDVWVLTLGRFADAWCEKDNTGEEWWYDRCGRIPSPSHWMPKPSGPVDSSTSDIIAEKDRRIQDLLEANNRYLERARKAEAEVERLKAESRPMYGLPGPDWKSDGQGYLVSPDGMRRVRIAPHAAAPLPIDRIATFTIGGETTSISPQTVWKSDRP